MGQEEILRKLNDALKKNINDECQVVYILSRMRKYLESKDIESKYKYLTFCCNWALHPRINRTKSVADVLLEFVKGTDGGRFLRFDPLLSDLRKFLNDQDLSREIVDNNENWWRFLNLLVDIYADTPLEVFITEKRVITIKKPAKRLEDSNFVVPCEIT